MLKSPAVFMWLWSLFPLPKTIGIFVDLRYNMMIPGSKGHKTDACIRFCDFGTRPNMRKEPFFEEKRADFECLEDFVSAKREEIRISGHLTSTS